MPHGGADAREAGPAVEEGVPHHPAGDGERLTASQRFRGGGHQVVRLPLKHLSERRIFCRPPVLETNVNE